MNYFESKAVKAVKEASISIACLLDLLTFDSKSPLTSPEEKMIATAWSSYA